MTTSCCSSEKHYARIERHVSTYLSHIAHGPQIRLIVDPRRTPFRGAKKRTNGKTTTTTNIPPKPAVSTPRNSSNNNAKSVFTVDSQKYMEGSRDGSDTYACQPILYGHYRASNQLRLVAFHERKKKGNSPHCKYVRHTWQTFQHFPCFLTSRKQYGVCWGLFTYFVGRRRAIVFVPRLYCCGTRRK